MWVSFTLVNFLMPLLELLAQDQDSLGVVLLPSKKRSVKKQASIKLQKSANFSLLGLGEGKKVLWWRMFSPSDSNSKYTSAVLSFCECVWREVIHITGSSRNKGSFNLEGFSTFLMQRRKNQATVPSSDSNLCECPFICVHIMWINLWGENWSVVT